MCAGNQIPVFSVYHRADEMTGKIYKLEVESPEDRTVLDTNMEFAD